MLYFFRPGISGPGRLSQFRRHGLCPTKWKCTRVLPCAASQLDDPRPEFAAIRLILLRRKDGDVTYVNEASQELEPSTTSGLQDCAIGLEYSRNFSEHQPLPLQAMQAFRNITRKLTKLSTLYNILQNLYSNTLHVFIIEGTQRMAML
jgi:hypothetical protein